MHTRSSPRVRLVDKIGELRLVGCPHPLGLILALTFDEPSPNAWRKITVGSVDHGDPVRGVGERPIGGRVTEGD